ncbi:hypothetical protein Y032_0274g1028, partial [Ancylostoma ceylanicum]
MTAKIAFNPYEVLGLDRGCSDKDVQRAYKQQCLRWHPDKNLDNKEEAERRFIAAKEAFHFLFDKSKRDEYDRDYERVKQRESAYKARMEKADSARKKFIDELHQREREFAERSKTVEHLTPAQAYQKKKEEKKYNTGDQDAQQPRMDTLPALLEAMQQQLDIQARRMDEQGTVLAKLMEKMSATPPSLNAGTPIVVMDKHAIFDSLHRRIEKFVYDPDRGRTFDIWLKRYQDLFDNECNDLDEKDKTRLLVSRLDENCHQMLTGAISPKQPSDLPWKEVIEVLERQFGSAKTLFRRRFECFKTRYEGQDFTNYEMLVKTKCTDAK